MGNIVSNDKANEDLYLKVSNGGMSVLVAALILSGSDLASTRWEQELVTWIAEHDQSVFGLGIVGFDLDDLAWDQAHFAEQQTFILRMIDGAIQRHRWEVLHYDPPYAVEYLQTLRMMVEQYRQEFVEPGKQWTWWSPPDEFVKCPLHQVYMHANGCTICHDQ